MRLPPTFCVAVLWIVTVCVTGCSGYSSVRITRPKAKAESLSGAVLKKALGDPRKEPELQIGRLLNAASLASDKLRRNPTNNQARRDYNFAIGRIFEVIHEAGLEPWKQPIKCPGKDGPWTFSIKTDGDPTHDPSLFRILPADRFEFNGSLVKQRTVKQGIGAPMVATSKPGLDFTKKDRFIMGQNVYYGLTVLIRFDGQRCTAVSYDPLQVENVQFSGHSFPLAADFTAAIGLALAELKPRRTELERMFRPDQFAGTSRLARLQPYEAHKIPILCIHGLGDSQATWAPLIESLRGDPVIRQHYQFWFYTYPTGFPYPLMAADLRKELDDMKVRYPGHKKFVVLGHSMGGMIARELITDSGMKLWNAYFDVPPHELKVSPEGRSILESTLIFNHRTDISRVVFLSASLGGSDVAVGFFGRLGKKLMGNSTAILGDMDDTMKAVRAAKPANTGEPILAMPNSLDALDPDNRFLTTINNIPPAPGIPYHSIIADRGKGGNLDKTKPVSTDGLVPYWSSHIDGAQSELIVPSGHWSNQNPQAIAEVRRILLSHIGRKAEPVAPSASEQLNLNTNELQLPAGAPRILD